MKKLILIFLILACFIFSYVRYEEKVFYKLPIYPRKIINFDNKLVVIGEDKTDLLNWNIILIENGKIETLTEFQFNPQEFIKINQKLFVICEETFYLDLNDKKVVKIDVPKEIPVKTLTYNNQIVLQYHKQIIVISNNSIDKKNIPDNLHLISYNDEYIFFFNLDGSIILVNNKFDVINLFKIPYRKDVRFVIFSLQPYSGFISTSISGTYIYQYYESKLDYQFLNDHINKVIALSDKVLLIGRNITYLKPDNTLKHIGNIKNDWVLIDYVVKNEKLTLLFNDLLTGEYILLSLDKNLKLEESHLRGKFISLGVFGENIILGKSDCNLVIIK